VLPFGNLGALDWLEDSILEDCIHRGFTDSPPFDQPNSRADLGTCSPYSISSCRLSGRFALVALGRVSL
jgi:hypothetical protein